MDIIILNKNNNLVLNLNLLNKTNQMMELDASDNLLGYLFRIVFSTFDFLFN